MRHNILCEYGFGRKDCAKAIFPVCVRRGLPAILWEFVTAWPFVFYNRFTHQLY